MLTMYHNYVILFLILFFSILLTITGQKSVRPSIIEAARDGELYFIVIFLKCLSPLNRYFQNQLYAH